LPTYHLKNTPDFKKKSETETVDKESGVSSRGPCGSDLEPRQNKKHSLKVTLRTQKMRVERYDFP